MSEAESILSAARSEEQHAGNRTRCPVHAAPCRCREARELSAAKASGAWQAEQEAAISAALGEERRAVDLLRETHHLMTVKEFAASRQMHVQTVYAAIRAGKLIYRAIRISRSSMRIAIPRDGVVNSHRPIVLFQGVYFVRCESFVKVGVTGDIRRRYRALMAATPFELTPVGFISSDTYHGALRLEREWHEKLRPWHHKYEWFRAADDALSLIASAAEPWPSTPAA